LHERDAIRSCVDFERLDMEENTRGNITGSTERIKEYVGEGNTPHIGM
jgi:hypothetical protein